MTLDTKKGTEYLHFSGIAASSLTSVYSHLQIKAILK